MATTNVMTLKDFASSITIDVRSMPERIKTKLMQRKSLDEAKREAKEEVNRTRRDVEIKMRELEVEIDRCTDPQKLSVMSYLLNKLRTFLESVVNTFLDFLRRTWEAMSTAVDWVYCKLRDIVEAIFH